MRSPSVLKPVLIVSGAIIVLFAMYLTAAFIDPILMALFCATLLYPIYRELKRRKVPNVLSMLLAISVLILAALFVVFLVGASLTTLAKDLPNYSEQFSQRQAELAAQSASQPVDISPLLSALDPDTLVSILKYVLKGLSEIASLSALVLFMTIFFLAEGPQFVKRLQRAYGPQHALTQNTITLAKMTISYFALRIIVNLATATGTGLMLWFFNIKYAGLWTVLLFFLSFIPYIGAFFATVPPAILAYAQGGMGLMLTVILLSVIINSITENILAPMVMGKGLSVSPTVVFLSCMFWMAVLGGIGALIAMPITIALILFMNCFAETRGLAAMMVTAPLPDMSPDSIQRGE